MNITRHATASRMLLTFFSGSLVLVLTGCSDSTSPAEPMSSTQSSATQPATPAWILTEMPAGAQGVAELKPNAKESDRIVLRGRIGGSANPLSNASPIFTIVDAAIPSCADNPDDHCKTPWDYCCEPRSILTANSATIQLIDAGGNPLVANPAALLSPLDEIIVVGTVAPRANGDVLLVKATGVFCIGG